MIGTLWVELSGGLENRQHRSLERCQFSLVTGTFWGCECTHATVLKYPDLYRSDSEVLRLWLGLKYIHKYWLDFPRPLVKMFVMPCDESS